MQDAWMEGFAGVAGQEQLQVDAKRGLPEPREVV
jgi:hypothetical protein